MRRNVSTILASLLVVFMAGAASAIPSLQLGPGATGSWSYNTGTQTWVTSGNAFELNALANASSSASGKYAWDAAGSAAQVAYLIVAATPQTTADPFDITISNDGSALSLAASGYGTPPVQDPNSIAPHGVFSTYFELYQFDFDGALGTIHDTQPGTSGTGPGFTEVFDVVINSLDTGSMVHFDLFTMEGDGLLANNTDLNAFVPFSHDASAPVPEPSAGLAFAIGMLLVGGHIRRR